jgi:serine/threonine protein kinase
MYLLSGAFLSRNDKLTIIDNKEYYFFKLIYPNKERVFYIETQEDYDNWISKLVEVLDFTEVSSKYEILEEVGQGKFGVVRKARNKKTSQLLAVKLINKHGMKDKDLVLVNAEIEILKICQHPNIIQVYEILQDENSMLICKLYI